MLDFFKKHNLREVALAVASVIFLMQAFIEPAKSQGFDIATYLELPQADIPYPFYSKNMDVQQALSLFGRNLNVAVDIDESIKGTIVSNKDANLSREQYLDMLSRKFGFFWYFDGVVLNFSGVNTIKTEVISLKKKNAVLALNLLVNLGIYQEKFMHRVDEKSSVFMVSGPEKYVEMVKSSLQSIEDSDTRAISVVRGSTGVAEITAASASEGLGSTSAVSSTINSNVNSTY